MKTNVFIFLFASLVLNLNAQNKVILEVTHKLEAEDFEFNKELRTLAGVKHTITRLDYFISNIKLYSGGSETFLPDQYIYVGNCNNFSIELGTFPFNKLDSISFAIGVDSVRNHADPAVWPAGHALSLLTSDMHWGWSGGYRFIALEGKNVDNKTYQIHALGDILLKRATVNTYEQPASGGELVVKVNAYMELVTRELDLTKQIWEHGESREAGTVLNAMAKNVFLTESLSSSEEELDVPLIRLYPNPIVNNDLFISGLAHGDAIKIYDYSGKLIIHEIAKSDRCVINLSQAGTYIALIEREGKVIYMQNVNRL